MIDIEGFYSGKYGKRNIKTILKSYTNSNDNPSREIEFYARMISYKKRILYLSGEDYDIRCNLKKDSYETFKGVICQRFVKGEGLELILSGIPFFSGYSFKIEIKQAEIIRIPEKSSKFNIEDYR